MALLTAIAITFAAALAAAGLHHLVQRRFGHETLSGHNDVAAAIYSAIGVIFAVILGFVVIVVWQRYDEVRGYVDTEVAGVIDLYHTAEGFPPPMTAKIRTQLISYANVVQHREWAAMSRGALAAGGSPDIENVSHEILAFRPANTAQQDIHQLALTQLQGVFDARRQRIRATEPSVPRLLWFSLWADAIATLGFTFLFGVKNRVAQLVMTATLAALVAVAFITIQRLDSPFEGTAGIPPTGWIYFADHIKAIGGP